VFHNKVANQLRRLRSRLGSLRRATLSQSKNTFRPYWSIGIYTGTSPLHISDAAESCNPVLTHEAVSDVRARSLADPFMIRTDGRWYMFFEVWNTVAQRGQIGLATSDDTTHWEYRHIVLAEPFHLSYPCTFEWKNEYYMIPESHEAQSIRLYKAKKFPDRWSFECPLIEGSMFSDPSVVHYAGKWWIFAQTNSQQRFDTLRLFFSEDLRGPWQEHPMSPIVNGNNRMARPAGRIQVINGNLIRFAQDCYPAYGTGVRAFIITELSTTKYRERECRESPILGPSGAGWNQSGMHHVDLHDTGNGKWVACVDGFQMKAL